MWRHNLMLILRTFKRNKTSFFINLIGLSTGLACTLLIYIWVMDELGVDKFHEKDANLYQVVQNFDRKRGMTTRPITPAYFGKMIQEEIPEVEYATAINHEYNFTDDGILSVGTKEVKAKPLFASKEYFNVFSFPLLEGDKHQVLNDKGSLVISERLAKTIFGSTKSSIGQLIKWEHDVFEGEYLVSGVFKNVPTNSTLQFDVVFNYELALDPYEESRDWSSDAARTFVVLKEGADLDLINKKMTDILHSKPYRGICSIFVQQFSSRYMYGEYENGKVAGGRIAYIKLFGLIAIFLLIIACVNFMNLSTARASTRMKEVGVRKTTGASRGSLIRQFLGESIVMVSISSLVAISLIYLFLPQFNTITEKQLSLNIGKEALLSILGIVLLTGIIAGSYPAFYLSSFNPAKVLKGKLESSFGEKWIRKGLVVFQFSLSVIFVIGFLIINRQIDFIQEKQLGYEKSNIVNFVSKGKGSTDINSFMLELKNVPGVLHATNIEGGSFIGNKNFGTAPKWEGADPNVRFRVPRPHVGYDYIETLGVEIKEGRSFSREYTDEDSKVVVNEAAVALMGLENPLGSILRRGETELQIIGVVKDFHNESLHKKISPTFIRFVPDGRNIMVKIKEGDELATIERLKKAYENFHNGFPFEFSFLDEDYQKMYTSENRIASLSNYFAGIAIIVSCLGLFGLAMFTTERRKKEIGIRKVLGASVLGIVRILTSDFTKTVVIAILISLPLSYWVAKNWLMSFAYAIGLSWTMFFVPAVVVLVIAWCTVGVQTFKAALANPVHSLKDE